MRGHYMGIGSIMNQACSETRSFIYYEPAGLGPLPIAVYLPGTMTQPDDPIFLMYLRRLADKGYVAVSVDYGQFAILCSFGCSCYKPRTDCLFNPAPEDSLVSAIASQTRGDPSLGIVVWGHRFGEKEAEELEERLEKEFATESAE